MLLYLEYEKTKNEGEQLRSEGGSSLSFFENQKSTFIFGKKGPSCVHIWVKNSIQNVILIVYRRKNSKICHCLFFLCF